MQTKRPLGPFEVSAVGLGCMNLSHAYGEPPAPDAAATVLLKALDLGYTLFDTAALYGFGKNEELVGQVLAPHRDKFILASKCGMAANAEGKREINGRPEVIKKTCEDALTRLKTDVIDLYYLHRWDKSLPIEDSIGAMADLVAEGKVRSLGVSEVSAATLRKAHAVHPIAAVQSEYSLWSRNPELGVLEACRDLGVAFVAFSPLARGFLPGTLRDVTTLVPKDIRRAMPRFTPENYAANLKLLDGFMAEAEALGCTPAQLALAWTLAKAPHVITLPGTTRLDHLAENAGACDLVLSPETVERLDTMFPPHAIKGTRYAPQGMTEVDTEDFS